MWSLSLHTEMWLVSRSVGSNTIIVSSIGRKWQSDWSADYNLINLSLVTHISHIHTPHLPPSHTHTLTQFPHSPYTQLPYSPLPPTQFTHPPPSTHSSRYVSKAWFASISSRRSLSLGTAPSSSGGSYLLLQGDLQSEGTTCCTLYLPYSIYTVCIERFFPSLPLLIFLLFSLSPTLSLSLSPTLSLSWPVWVSVWKLSAHT